MFKKSGTSLIESAVSKVTGIIDQLNEGIEKVNAEKASTNDLLNAKKEEWQKTEASLTERIANYDTVISKGTALKTNISKLLDI